MSNKEISEAPVFLQTEVAGSLTANAAKEQGLVCEQQQKRELEKNTAG